MLHNNQPSLHSKLPVNLLPVLYLAQIFTLTAVEVYINLTIQPPPQYVHTVGNKLECSKDLAVY